MNHITALFAFTLCITGLSLNGQILPPQPLQIGEIQTLHSQILDEDRTLNVYLPHGFSPDSTYPVIYLLDGSYHEDLLHIVGLVQFFNLQFGMPPHIIVGIANVDRKRDFTFATNDEEMMSEIPTAGHSAAFISFIEEELQPFIENTYPVNNKKYLIGQSLGGLLASEILLKKPALFSHYLIVSPSLWWDNQSLLEKAPKLLADVPDTSLYVYLSVGAKEHKIMVKDAKTFNQLLSNTSQIKVDFNLMKKENHASILHNSIYEGLQRLFPVE